jgi:translation initiation factor IF-2
VIGGVVSEGRLLVGKAVRISRRETELARGKILELRQQKIIVKEVPENTQFGALLEAKIALAPGDVIECFELTVK